MGFRILKYLSEPKDTFLLYGNIFENKFYPVPPNFGGLQKLEQFLQFEDSLLVKIGNDRSLLQSRDKAQTWELVSYVSGNPKYIFNDSTYIFFEDALSFFGLGQNYVNRTYDYGTTFQPTNIPRNELLEPATSILRDFRDNAIFYMDDTGKGFFGGDRKSNEIRNRFVVTYDSGRNYAGFGADRIHFGNPRDNPSFSNVVNIRDKYLFATYYISGIDNDKYLTTIYIPDTNLRNITEIHANRKPYAIGYDTMYFAHYFLADNFEKYLIFASAQDENDLEHIRFVIYETSDSGRVRKPILSIDQELHFNQFYEHNKDSLFFSTSNPDRLYLYDRQRNKIDTLYQGNEDKKILLMILSNKFYIVGEKIFLENTNRDDLTQWKVAEWDYGLPSFESVIFRGNVALAKLSDSLRPSNNYRIMLREKSPTSINVENETEKEYDTTHFWASVPYPQPGVDKIHVRLAWSGMNDIMESIDGVYNIYGEKFEGKENMSFDKYEGYTGELKWDCSHIGNGMYFILAQHSGGIDCIPILVIK